MNMTEDTEEAILRFATMAAGQWEPDGLALRARELWMECGFGQARCHTNERRDAGVKRAQAQGKSEHSWLQERRRATKALASGRRNAPAGEERDLGEAWTEKHQAELEKQRKKIVSNKLKPSEMARCCATRSLLSFNKRCQKRLKATGAGTPCTKLRQGAERLSLGAANPWDGCLGGTAGPGG